MDGERPFMGVERLVVFRVVVPGSIVLIPLTALIPLETSRANFSADRIFALEIVIGLAGNLFINNIAITSAVVPNFSATASIPTIGTS